MIKNGRWGTKAYLESLHSTYDKPLPKRDDASFQRALQFREQEKAFFRGLQDENDQLRRRLSQMQTTLTDLERDSDTLLQFYNDTKTSSKRVNDDTDGNAKRPDDSTRGGSRGNDDGAQLREPGGGGAAGKAGRGEGRAEGVHGEVLPADVPDRGGSSTEHAGDGPEHGEGDPSGGGRANPQ